MNSADLRRTRREPASLTVESPNEDRPTGRGPQKRLLIVSPAFAPMSTPDSQRARMSLPYYSQNGWKPIVLAVSSERVDAPREDSLLETVPTSVLISHCSALAQKTGRRFGLGNLGWRAWWPILFAGARLIREQRIDLVFFSTTQFAVLPLGRIWQRWLGVPYVIDLQDPWRTDYYERAGVRRPPGGWKYQLARAQAAVLESWSFQKMSGLISVSDRYLQDLSARYRWFARIPTATIRFGASEHDLAVAKEQIPARTPIENRATLRFVYTGAAGPITPHAVSVFFTALSAFREQSPEAASRIRCEFIGTSYAAAASATATILPLAEKFGVSDLVSERPERVGHLECLRLQAEADVLLMLGSSDLAYSPSKLYPYFLAKRPMLSVVFRHSTLEKLLRELDCSELIAFDETDSAEAVARIMAFLARAHTEGLSAMPSRNEAHFRNHFLAQTLTAQQAELFDRASAFARRDESPVI